MFDWDQSNLRKIRAHRVKAAEVEQALSREPILIYEQTADGEVRYVYYGENGTCPFIGNSPDGTRRQDPRYHGLRPGCWPEARLPGAARARGVML